MREDLMEKVLKHHMKYIAGLTTQFPRRYSSRDWPDGDGLIQARAPSLVFASFRPVSSVFVPSCRAKAAENEVGYATQVGFYVD